LSNNRNTFLQANEYFKIHNQGFLHEQNESQVLTDLHLNVQTIT